MNTTQPPVTPPPHTHTHTPTQTDKQTDHRSFIYGQTDRQTGTHTHTHTIWIPLLTAGDLLACPYPVNNDGVPLFYRWLVPKETHGRWNSKSKPAQSISALRSAAADGGAKSNSNPAQFIRSTLRNLRDGGVSRTRTDRRRLIREGVPRPTARQQAG